MTSRLSRHGLFCFLAWLLCAGLYVTTAEGVSIRYHDRENAWHHYEYLVDGFLGAHLYLSRTPSPELLALPDPYDPKANDGHRLWDASFYHGKFYLYYGPAPAVLLMLPWKLITGHHLPQWGATVLFAIIGFGALALLLAGIRKKYFSGATPAQLFFAVLLAGHISWLPVILRRPAFWELPIVTAASLFWLSLFFLWKYHTTGRLSRWAWAGGIALGCGPGARPTYALTAGFMLLLFALPLSRRRSLPNPLRELLPVIIPLAAGGCALIAYNYLRFGAVLEFGQSYQIWGVDYRGAALFSPANVLTNIWVYFCTLPDLSPYFPFFRTAWVGPGVQPGYLGTEEMPGLLFTMPALALGFATWLHAWRTRGDSRFRAFRILVAAATCGGGVTGLFLFAFAGGCSRYITELLAGWTLVTSIGGFAIFTKPLSRPLGGVPRLLAGVSIIWTITCVWLASFEFRRFTQTTQPNLYRAIATTLNYPSYWMAERAGEKFGPVALDIRIPEKFARGDTIVLATGRQDMLNQLIIERLAPHRVRIRVAVNDLTIIATPVMQHGSSLIHIELHAPWLYPPIAHPYWRRFKNPVQRNQLQAITVLATPAVTMSLESKWFFDSLAFGPYIRTSSKDRGDGAWVEAMSRLDPFASVAGSAAAASSPEALERIPVPLY